MFKKYLVLKESTEAPAPADNTNKDWRKGFIQLEKGFIPPPAMRPVIEAFLNSKAKKVILQRDVNKDIPMPGKSLFLVGGSVRDFLLGKSPHDYDLATDATPEQIAQILDASGFKCPGKVVDGKLVPDHDRSGKRDGKQLDLKFNPQIAKPGDNKTWMLTGRDSSKEQKPFVITATVDNQDFQIATFRKDAKVTDGQAEVNFVDNPEEDAARRDFTINSLYIELSKPDGENTKLYDPTKKGWHDIMHGQVRAVGKAGERFEEDKVRIMRAIRFHSQFGKGSKMDKEIEEAIPKFSHLSGVSLERIRDEFIKGLIHPDVDPVRYLSIYARTGLIQKVFPGLKITGHVPNQFRDKKDKVLALAWVLQDNPTDQIETVMGPSRRVGANDLPTGWPSQERKAVVYLLKLKEFHPDNVQDLLDGKKGTGLSADQIRNWVDYFNITDAKGRVRHARPTWAKQVRAFAEFEPDPSQLVNWQQKHPCPACKGAKTGCSVCNGKGYLKGDIHPEITKRGLHVVNPTQRDQVVRSLNREKLRDMFMKTLPQE